MARIEKNIAKLQANKEEIEQRMAGPELYDGDTSIVVSLQKDLGWISQQILEAEEAWITVQQELEAAQLGG